METYPTDRLYEEVAFIAYHFGWSREEIMEMPHEERQRWCEEISNINEQMNDGGGGPQEPTPTDGMRTTKTEKGLKLTQPIRWDDEDEQDTQEETHNG